MSDPVEQKLNPSSVSIPGVTEVLSKVPKPQRETVMKVAIAIASHQSPLPPPAVLQEYNAIIPNGADRIMRLVENQSEHRIATESLKVNAAIKIRQSGQFTAAFIALAFLCAAVYLALNGHDAVAGVVAGLDILGLVAIFVTGRHSASQATTAETASKPSSRKSKRR